MRLVDLRTAVLADLKAKLPGLRSAAVHGGRFDLEELKRYSAQAPALRVAVLGAPSLADTGDERTDVDATLVAYVLTTDAPQLPRDVAALNLCEVLLAYIPHKRWGLQDIGAPERVSASNLYDGGLDRQAVALWAVSWSQRVRLGESVFAEDGTLPSEIYASWVPDVGIENQDKYTPIHEFLPGVENIEEDDEDEDDEEGEP